MGDHLAAGGRETDQGVIHHAGIVIMVRRANEPAADGAAVLANVIDHGGD